ncbi:MAG: hypothetical protein PWP23_745 [Candidatus Sumerlaeota bacterium]|nr:hypothetical protein [Candidatus Sumerlaeota bacterium]
MTREFDDSEAEGALPPGWTPASDADPRWRGIVGLMADADAPGRVPSAAEFRAMRERVREELARESGGARVLPVRPAEDSFAGWVRQIAVGGGAGGQLVRFAAVAAAAFAIGAFTMQRNAGSGAPPAPPPVGVASLPPTTVSNPALDESTVIPVSSSGYRTFNYNLPNGNVSGGDSGSLSLERSGLDNTGRLIPTGAAQGWYVSSHGGQAVLERQEQAGTETVQLLQELRLRSLIESDPGQLATLRQLEDALSELLTVENVLPQAKVDDLGLINRADDLVADGQPEEALAAYREIAAGSGGAGSGSDSFLAFVAQFQAARLLYEELHDYRGALQAYRAVLEDHPSHYLTDEQRQHALERIEILTRNYQDDWRAVSLWQAAQQQTGAKQEALWAELVDSMPQAPLAADAAVALAGQLVQPRPRTDGSAPEELAVLFQNALQRAGSSPHAAGFRFALAEVFLVGLMEPERAEAEYRQLLTMPGAEPYAAKAQTRLRHLERRR